MAMRIAATLGAAVLVALGSAYSLTYEPAPRVGIQWRSGISAGRRAALERRFLLVNPGLEGDRPMYDLLDTSRPNVEALVRERDVTDTDRVSRERFEIRFDVPYGTSWMWVAHRTPVLRIPGMVTAIAALCILVFVAGFAADTSWVKKWRTNAN